RAERPELQRREVAYGLARVRQGLAEDGQVLGPSRFVEARREADAAGARLLGEGPVGGAAGQEGGVLLQGPLVFSQVLAAARHPVGRRVRLCAARSGQDRLPGLPGLRVLAVEEERLGVLQALRVRLRPARQGGEEYQEQSAARVTPAHPCSSRVIRSIFMRRR